LAFIVTFGGQLTFLSLLAGVRLMSKQEGEGEEKGEGEEL